MFDQIRIFAGAHTLPSKVVVANFVYTHRFRENGIHTVIYVIHSRGICQCIKFHPPLCVNIPVFAEYIHEYMSNVVIRLMRKTNSAY